MPPWRSLNGCTPTAKVISCYCSAPAEARTPGRDSWLFRVEEWNPVIPTCLPPACARLGKSAPCAWSVQTVLPLCRWPTRGATTAVLWRCSPFISAFTNARTLCWTRGKWRPLSGCAAVNFPGLDCTVTAYLCRACSRNIRVSRWVPTSCGVLHTGCCGIWWDFHRDRQGPLAQPAPMPEVFPVFP